MEKVRVGIIGCGMISEIYMKNITTRFCDVLKLKACANRSPEAAEKRAAQFGIQAMTIDEILADPGIEFILNLTPPASHYTLNKRILEAGKHCYCEKPFADTLEQGRELLAIAEEKSLLAASAPDTFLGAGIQTCLSVLKEGLIGRPVSVQAFMLGSGPERFHPNPAFFYQQGGGPLLDMGPYYYTALAALFGPAKRVTGFSRRIDAERKIWNTESKFYPGTVPVEVDTFVQGTVEFENGVIANVTTSWDFDFPYYASPLPLLTVLGTEGTLFMPDPNTFGGTDGSVATGEPGSCVYIERGDKREEIPLRYGYAENSRGLGAYEMAHCIREGVSSRLNGSMSLHVLEMMLGIASSAETGESYEMTTSFENI